MRAYADRVDQEVKQQWDNMRQEMGTIPDDASVTVNFSVDRNGQMVNPEVIVNSDSPEVNAAAVEALQRANFEPLPDNYQGEEFRLQEEMSIEKVN
jgi:TonB family protein